MSRLHCAGKLKAICAYKHNDWLLSFWLDDFMLLDFIDSISTSSYVSLFHGRFLRMLLDVNTVLQSRACGKRGRCSCYSSVFWIYSWTRRISRLPQTQCLFSVSRRKYHILYPRLHLGVQVSHRHSVSSASFATRNLQPDAEQTVTAVIPHALARRVQTLATCDLFLWQHDQMFLLDFFANTVLHRSVRVLYFIENKLIPQRI